MVQNGAFGSRLVVFRTEWAFCTNVELIALPTFEVPHNTLKSFLDHQHQASI